jgi:hypothetical protein
MMAKQDAIFVLSVDTEEEWIWENEFPDHNFSVNNVSKLPDFQSFCDSLGIRTTYFVDYAVANDPRAKDIVKDISLHRSCEIGAHLHPWCNPPYFGKTTEFESHCLNLPTEQVASKLDALTERLVTEFGRTPTSFRSGRWGIDGRILKLLSTRGYKVDSSVYPFYENEYFSCKGAPTFPYWPDYRNSLTLGVQRDILEIPVSAGFNRVNFGCAEKIHSCLATYLGWTKAVGFLWHTNALKKLYLSPELTNTNDMCSLVKTCLRNQHPVIHMYLHSSSLIDGATGLLDKRNAYTLICERIKGTLAYLKQHAHVSFATVTEASGLLQQATKPASILKWEKETA